MTHGAMEADKWYNPEIQTGIQGYNYGMQLLDKYFGDMYINLSISPVFLLIMLSLEELLVMRGIR